MLFKIFKFLIKLKFWKIYEMFFLLKILFFVIKLFVFFFICFIICSSVDFLLLDFFVISKNFLFGILRLILLSVKIDWLFLLLLYFLFILFNFIFIIVFYIVILYIYYLKKRNYIKISIINNKRG